MEFNSTIPNSNDKAILTLLKAKSRTKRLNKREQKEFDRLMSLYQHSLPTFYLDFLHFLKAKRCVVFDKRDIIQDKAGGVIDRNPSQPNDATITDIGEEMLGNGELKSETLEELKNSQEKKKTFRIDIIKFIITVLVSILTAYLTVKLGHNK